MDDLKFFDFEDLEFFLDVLNFIVWLLVSFLYIFNSCRFVGDFSGDLIEVKNISIVYDFSFMWEFWCRK